MVTHGQAVMDTQGDCCKRDNKDDLQTTSTERRKESPKQQAKATPKHLKTVKKNMQHNCTNLICLFVTAAYDQLLIRGGHHSASSSVSLQLVVGLRGSIRLNRTFFIGSYRKPQQTGEEGQLQPSANQLTGDLAQQRFLPRCPTLFLT